MSRESKISSSVWVALPKAEKAYRKAHRKATTSHGLGKTAGGSACDVEGDFLTQIMHRDETDEHVRSLLNRAHVSRRLQEMVREYSDRHKDRPDTSFEDEVAFGRQILYLRTVYPGIFAKLFSGFSDDPFEKVDASDVLAAADMIHAVGGLPESTRSHKSVDPEEMYRDAALEEEITRLLLAYPPAKDFMDDHDIGRVPYDKGAEREMTVEHFKELMKKSDALHNRIRRWQEKFRETNEGYNNAQTSEAQQVQLRNMLNLTRHELGALFDGWDSTIFELRTEVEKLMNGLNGNGETKNLDDEPETLDDKNSIFDNVLKECKLTQDAAIKHLREVLRDHNRIIDDIVSGKAAVYESPKTKLTM
ncbi:hypothetical protein EOL96_08915 [Candidatus Saccharibacteria bacterium]|nr:hypothetical protein [Candidatus Saccharibacteria bacterium]